MRYRHALVLLPLLLLHAGCGRSARPTTPTGDSPHAVVPPAAPAAAMGVIHYDDGVVGLVFGGDPRDGLAVSVGYETPMADICADPTGFVTSSGGGVLVHTASGRIPIVTFSREASTEVYAYGAGPVTDPCSQLLGAPLVAEGRVMFTFEATDISGLAGNGPGAFAVEARANGVVVLATGGRARLLATVRFLGGPDGPLRLDEERVSLDPL